MLLDTCLLEKNLTVGAFLWPLFLLDIFELSKYAQCVAVKIYSSYVFNHRLLHTESLDLEKTHGSFKIHTFFSNSLVPYQIIQI